MAKHRVCFRLPTFVVQLSFEAAERDISYEEIAASISPNNSRKGEMKK